MSECLKKGCRYLQTTCVTCGRIVCTAALPKQLEWVSVKDKVPPQDGRSFLGFDPENNEKIYVLVWDPPIKYTGELERCSREGCYREASGECYFHWIPTHWMPLPSPPKE